MVLKSIGGWVRKRARLSPEAHFVGRILTGRSSKKEIKREAGKFGKGLVMAGGIGATMFGTGKFLKAGQLGKALLVGSGGLVGTGVLAESKKARVGLVTAPSRAIKFGADVGKFSEGRGERPSISSGLKAAGLIGGGTAAVLGGAALIKKFRQPKTGINGFGSSPEIPSIQQFPEQVSPKVEDKKKVEEIVPMAQIQPTAKPINIKNVVDIDITSKARSYRDNISKRYLKTYNY